MNLEKGKPLILWKTSSWTVTMVCILSALTGFSFHGWTKSSHTWKMVVTPCAAARRMMAGSRAGSEVIRRRSSPSPPSSSWAAATTSCGQRRAGHPTKARTECEGENRSARSEVAPPEPGRRLARPPSMVTISVGGPVLPYLQKKRV